MQNQKLLIIALYLKPTFFHTEILNINRAQLKCLHFPPWSYSLACSHNKVACEYEIDGNRIAPATSFKCIMCATQSFMLQIR